MTLWDRLRDLPLQIEGYALERLERDVSSDFHRVTTVIRLHGGSREGVGEDVTYDTPDHDVLQSTGPILPLAGEWTLESLCDHVETLDLWPAPAQREASALYRVWAYESAALDLALRQRGVSLAQALDLEPAPVRFVVSLRLGTPSTLEPLRRRLDRYPDLRFKLDPTNDWTAELVAAVAATGAVDSVDFKGHYSGSIVDVAADPQLYQIVLEALPEAWLEDPHHEPAILELLTGDVRERVSWDAPIHSVADIQALPWKPAMVNVKPSRSGGLRSLLAAYQHCEAEAIGMYGGGQFELGPGRGQIQYLASLFHAAGPNDVAPSGYNDPDPPAGLPGSPLAVAAHKTGFGWG